MEVTCNQVLSAANEIILRVCGWKGFAAFWMEDRHSFGNEYNRELIFKPGELEPTVKEIP